MKNKKWKEFGKLTGTCYVDLGMGTVKHEIWDRAFEVLKEIVTDGRSRQPESVAELYLLYEITDYKYDVQGWLEDYLMLCSHLVTGRIFKLKTCHHQTNQLIP